MNRNTEYDEIHGIETDLDKEFENDREREQKEPYISIIGVLIDVEAKQQTVKEGIAEIMSYMDAQEQAVREEVVAEIMKSLDFTAIYDGIYHKRGDILRILRKALSNTKKV